MAKMRKMKIHPGVNVNPNGIAGQQQSQHVDEIRGKSKEALLTKVPNEFAMYSPF
jgi:hypothetical protein